jgi:hypothetical protein
MKFGVKNEKQKNFVEKNLRRYLRINLSSNGRKIKHNI